MISEGRTSFCLVNRKIASSIRTETHSDGFSIGRSPFPRYFESHASIARNPCKGPLEYDQRFENATHVPFVFRAKALFFSFPLLPFIFRPCFLFFFTSSFLSLVPLVRTMAGTKSGDRDGIEIHRSLLKIGETTSMYALSVTSFACLLFAAIFLLFFHGGLGRYSPSVSIYFATYRIALLFNIFTRSFILFVFLPFRIGRYIEIAIVIYVNVWFQDQKKGAPMNANH